MTDTHIAAERIIEQVETVIVGKRDVIRHTLVALLCDGHVLLEDVPGLGKTVLARALAGAVGGTFARVQFTPDVLPTDITGSMVFDPRTAEFTYRPGPILTNVLLADEINRCGPRTQSALLEAMAERQVSVELEVVVLPRPFLVIATQNPIELEGTFPLPEAQLDRFLMRLSLGYPDLDDELAMLRRFRLDEPLSRVACVVTTDELLAMQARVREVTLNEVVEGYLLDVVRATRDHEELQVGASPRASLALARAAQAVAAIDGRDFVRPDDVRDIAPAVLAHRLVTTAQADLLDHSALDILTGLLATVPVPVEATD